MKEKDRSYHAVGDLFKCGDDDHIHLVIRRYRYLFDAFGEVMDTLADDGVINYFWDAHISDDDELIE